MSGEQHPHDSDEGAAVRQWLEAINMGQDAGAFSANKITMELLPTLTSDDLKECGVEFLGHRKLILQTISKQFPGGAVAAPKPATQAEASSRVPATGGAHQPQVPPPASQPVQPGAALHPVMPSAGIKETAPPRKSLWRRMSGSKIFMLSIVAHILFGVAAGYFIVQRIQAKRKLTFQGGPPSPNPSTRALEHKMNMTRVKQTMSAPAQAKRITSTGLSKISLPDMPVMAGATDIVPDKMAGMGGTGIGFGPMGGLSTGMGTSGGGTVPLFGSRESGNGLVGTFYDLKRTKNREMDGMTPDQYASELNKFVQSGWNDSAFDKYLKGTHKLYTTQIFMPRIDSHEGPKAFGSEEAEPPGLWIALYKGQVSPAESGVYHFVAAGDDVMYIKFNGRVILDRCLYGNPVVQAVDSYKYPAFTFVNNGFAKSLPVSVQAGQFYDIEILIGDQIPLDFWAFVMIEKTGVTYQKDAGGAPILPVFRLSADRPRANPSGGKSSPPYQPDGPVWQGRLIESQTPVIP